MERLTERVENCPDPKEIYGVWVKDHDYVAAAQRLADYEDTGLSPEGIVKMGMAYEDSKRYAARLEGRVKAYGERRIVVLPCKVGDELWTLTSIRGDRYRLSDRPYRVKVVFIGLGSGSTFFHVEYSNGRVFPIVKEQFGKTVFRTREEAEKSLEKRFQELYDELKEKIEDE